MKTGNYNFQWYEKEDARKVLRVSIGKDGKMYLGQGMRELLPSYIKVGFDEKNRVLAIARGSETDIVLPKAGVFNMRTLAEHITAIGLELPVSFQMSANPTNVFVGEIIPRRKKHRCSSKWQWDRNFEQFLIIYQPLLDSLVYKFAKSTPLPERKSCAGEALFKALNNYTPAVGDLDRYVEKSIHSALMEQNKLYVQTYRNRSLDKPLTNDNSDEFCLYDMIEDSSSGGIDEIESRIMNEQFIDSLSPEEKKLLEMLRSGFQVPEIALRLGMDEEKVQSVGEAIGRKRIAFYHAEV